MTRPLRRPRRSAVLIGVCTVLGLLGLVAFTVAATRPTPRPCPTGPVPNGLAIAVGDRANSPKPQLPAEVTPAIAAVIADSEHGRPNRGVTLVRVDGRPTIGCVMTFSSNAGNSIAAKHDREQFMAVVRQRAEALAAAERDADPLTALSRAAAAAGPGGTIVLVDSGLQTVAPLDFGAKDLLDADTDHLVGQLARAGELPDLHDRTVILAGIGYTAPPQPPLSENQRTHLIELWQKIVVAAGGRQVTVTAPNTTPSDPGLPAVKQVNVPTPGNVSVGCNTESILDNDGAVGFEADKTTFRDAAAAQKVLARFATWLSQNPSHHATVVGSIAHYDNENGLSGARAVRVRDVLVQFGAAPDQVTAVGAGWGPFPDRHAPPDEVSDRRNRRVVIQLSC